MLGRLIVLSGPDQGLVFVIPEGAPFLIGRSSATATQLSDPRVSRTHCRVDFDRGALRLVDVGSKRGTYVNGQRIDDHPLRQGDIIRVGDTAMRFQGEPPGAGAAGPRSPAYGVQLAPALPEGPPYVPEIGAAISQGAAYGPANPPALPQYGQSVLDPDGAIPKSRPAGFEPVVEGPVSLADMVGKNLAHFAIQRALATSTTGVVFQAADLRQGRAVALKVLWPEACRDEQESRQFLDAMRSVIPIEHPNIVRLYETDRTGPFCWLSLEFVEGETLAQVIRRIGPTEKLDWRYSYRVGVQLARALKAVHGRGMVHCCVTPSNLHVRTADQVVKLGNLMFGKAVRSAFRIARFGDLLAAKVLARAAADGATHTGELPADLFYMPPEHADQAGEMDVRGDIYCAGATLYALLTGQPPCDAETLTDVVERIRYVKPDDPRKFHADIPESLALVVLKTLEKRRADRHQTPDELLADLDRVGEYQRVPV